MEHPVLNPLPHELMEKVLNMVVAEYLHACLKHPYYADTVLPDCVTVGIAQGELHNLRVMLKDQIAAGKVNAATVIYCELYEAFEALKLHDRTAFVTEVSQVMATVIRMLQLGVQEIHDWEERQKVEEV